MYVHRYFCDYRFTCFVGQITSLFVRKVLGAMDEDVDKNAFMRSVGIDPHAPVDPSLMVQDTAYYDFLERLACVENSPTTISLRAGAAMECNDYGAFGLAFKAATNLRGSYLRAERYARVLTNVSNYDMEPAGDQGAYVHLHRDGERRLGLRISNEATIASITNISREVSSTFFNPLAVYFKHPAPNSTAAHEEYFGCPVYWNTERDALLVSHEALKTPNRLGDAGMAQFFDTHLEDALTKLAQDQSLDQRVRIQVSKSLSEGVPAVSDIARNLGMSGRTLQRKLSGQGHTFQTLVEEARRQLAERLLHQTNYSLTEVAFMTGYSEQSAFNRAFKRWAGQTPRSYRLQTQK